MQKQNPQLGPLGAKFFAYSQMNSLNLVRLGELQKALGLSAQQERRLLERLNKSGFIFRLQRGIYMVPEKIPAGGFWQPNEYLIIATYMQQHNAKYYIGGLAAFNRHGFSTQIPNQYTVYNDQVSGLKKFGKISVKFIKKASKNIIGFESVPITSENTKINIANQARTILDAINDDPRYHMLPEAYTWLEQKYKNADFLEQFILLSIKSSSKKTMRRIGFYLEKLGVSEHALKPIFQKLATTSDWIMLIPSTNRRGKTNKKWRIIDNAEQHQ